MAQQGPLRGIRVLDVTQMIAGPYCAMMLADAGAEVIKIERPGVGDLTRQFGPFIERDGRRVSAYFMRFARDKRSVTLNLGHPTGQELLRGLVRHADVLLENFQPGTMERFGLGWPALRELNPRLVYATISGFGHSDIYESPYWERMALDLVAQAYSGLMDLNGEPDGPPVVIPGAVGDVIPAMLTAYGVMLALWQRGATGQGQHVDVSMYDALTAVAERAVMVYGVTGEHMRRGERTLNAPYSVFRAKDGYIGIGALTQDQWRRLCAAMGRPDLLEHPQLGTPALRADHDRTLLRPLIEGWLADKTPQEAAAILLEHDVPSAPVQRASDLFSCPHVAARRMLLDVPDGLGGTVKLVGRPVKLSASPEAEPGAAPHLGEHTEAVLGELLGLSAAEVLGLREAGIV
ncbi:MAG: CoA transferase [Chloroflexi bacterium]|nr:CoA transferase [Chloroflexota bacterium]